MCFEDSISAALTSAVEIKTAAITVAVGCRFNVFFEPGRKSFPDNENEKSLYYERTRCTTGGNYKKYFS